MLHPDGRRRASHHAGWIKRAGRLNTCQQQASTEEYILASSGTGIMVVCTRNQRRQDMAGLGALRAFRTANRFIVGHFCGCVAMLHNSRMACVHHSRNRSGQRCYDDEKKSDQTHAEYLHGVYGYLQAASCDTFRRGHQCACFRPSASPTVFPLRFMRADTEPVIPQNLNDAALPGPPWIVCLSHPNQLFPKLRENDHAPVHRRELLACDLMGRCAIL